MPGHGWFWSAVWSSSLDLLYHDGPAQQSLDLILSLTSRLISQKTCLRIRTLACTWPWFPGLFCSPHLGVVGWMLQCWKGLSPLVSCSLSLRELLVLADPWHLVCWVLGYFLPSTRSSFILEVKELLPLKKKKKRKNKTKKLFWLTNVLGMQKFKKFTRIFL